jgi:hypothetical protein
MSHTADTRLLLMKQISFVSQFLRNSKAKQLQIPELKNKTVFTLNKMLRTSLLPCLALPCISELAL